VLFGGGVPISGVADVMLFGGETPIIGLVPAELISVEPRGIVLPAIADPEPIGTPNGEADPVGETVCEPDVQFDVALASPAMPPPSKVVLIPEPLMVGEEAVVLQVGEARGLKPPGSISVAPSGMHA
jgi:hypothetical protein